MFVGIARTKTGLALTAGPTAATSVNVLADNGASQHYFGGAVIPRLRDGLHHCNVLDRLDRRRQGGF